MFGAIDEFDKALPELVKKYGKEFNSLLNKWNEESPYFQEIMFDDARNEFDKLYDSLPEEVHLFRMVGALEEQFVKDGGRGLHWAYDTDGMAEADKNCDISEVFPYIMVTEGITDRSNIDWDAVFLYLIDGYGEEHELRVKEPSEVRILRNESMTSEEFRDKYWKDKSRY